jgi:hypothetical protein
MTGWLAKLALAGFASKVASVLRCLMHERRQPLKAHQHPYSFMQVKGYMLRTVLKFLEIGWHDRV